MQLLQQLNMKTGWFEKNEQMAKLTYIQTREVHKQ